VLICKNGLKVTTLQLSL